MLGDNFGLLFKFGEAKLSVPRDVAPKLNSWLIQTVLAIPGKIKHEQVGT